MSATQQIPESRKQGRGATRAPLRRAVFGGLIAAAGVGITIILGEFAGATDWPALILYAVAIGVGIYVGNWRAMLAVFIAFVALGILFEVGSFVIMGSSWWEQQNAVHWSGDAPAYTKLLGQVLEYAVFGVFFALLAGTGVLIRRGYGRFVARRHPPVGA